MFLGQVVCTKDAKDRVGLPVIFRELLFEQVVMTQGFDRNILILPQEVFVALSFRLSSLNLADPNVRRLQRILLGNAAYLQINKNGTVQIPAVLRDFAGLGSKVVMVGQGKYLELWCQEVWQREIALYHDTDANSDKFISLNLSGL